MKIYIYINNELQFIETLRGILITIKYVSKIMKHKIYMNRFETRNLMLMQECSCIVIH